MAKTDLTAEFVKKLFYYCPDTGIFYRRIATSNVVKAGTVVGTKTQFGYLCVQINRSNYMLHRLSWLYFYGNWPTAFIDHINGNRTDNRIENLREATQAQNLQNKTIGKTNSSGFVGVTFHKQTNKWVAGIKVNGKRHYLGLYDSPEVAHEKYKQAKLIMHTFNPILR